MNDIAARGDCVGRQSFDFPGSSLTSVALVAPSFRCVSRIEGSRLQSWRGVSVSGRSLWAS